MGYATGTITSATPGDALRQQVETLLTAHSTWEFIESVVISNNTYYVWRCRGSGVAAPNSWGTDFYIALRTISTSAPSFAVVAFEDWDATNNLALRPCNTGGLATNADGSALATGGVALNNGSIAITTYTLDNSPNINTYYIQVSKNALKIGLRKQSSVQRYGTYAGLFETFLPAETTEFPLCLMADGSANINMVQSNAGMAYSRHPKRISQAAATYHHIGDLSSWTARSGNTSQVDMFFGKAQTTRLLAAMYGATVGTAPQTYGYLRGLLYDCVVVDAGSGVTITVGDTLTVDGVLHTLMPFEGWSTWVNQSAA